MAFGDINKLRLQFQPMDNMFFPWMKWLGPLICLEPQGAIKKAINMLNYMVLKNKAYRLMARH